MNVLRNALSLRADVSYFLCFARTQARMHSAPQGHVRSLTIMYLLTEWEGRTGKYLARGQDVRTSLRSVRAS